MKFSRTWIDTHLSAKEREQLVTLLLERSAAPTAQMILDALHEYFPHLEDLPSLNSCNEWRRKSLAFEIQRREIREESQAAHSLAGAAGANFADANRVLTEQILFEQLQALRAARDGEDVAIDAGALHDWILSASRLAQTSQREQALQAKLRELEAKEEERRAAAEKLKAAAERAKGAGGITEETMRDIERQVRML